MPERTFEAYRCETDEFAQVAKGAVIRIMNETAMDDEDNALNVDIEYIRSNPHEFVPMGNEPKITDNSDAELPLNDEKVQKKGKSMCIVAFSDMKFTGTIAECKKHMSSLPEGVYVIMPSAGKMYEVKHEVTVNEVNNG